MVEMQAKEATEASVDAMYPEPASKPIHILRNVGVDCGVSDTLATASSSKADGACIRP